MKGRFALYSDKTIENQFFHLILSWPKNIAFDSIVAAIISASV